MTLCQPLRPGTAGRSALGAPSHYLTPGVANQSDPLPALSPPTRLFGRVACLPPDSIQLSLSSVFVVL